MSELRDVAEHLNEVYGTGVTEQLVAAVDEVENELRQLKKCQCCPNEATRHLCDKPHQLP